jgi:hypothetical protein
MMSLSRNRRGHTRLKRSSAGHALAKSCGTIHPRFGVTADGAKRALADPWVSRCAAQLSAPRGLPDPGAGDAEHTAESLVGRYLGQPATNRSLDELRATYTAMVTGDVPKDCREPAARLTAAILDLNVAYLTRLRETDQPTESMGLLMGFHERGLALVPPDRLIRTIVYPVDAYTVTTEAGDQLVGSSWPGAVPLLVLRAALAITEAIENRRSPPRSFEALSPAGWTASDRLDASAHLADMLGVPAQFDLTGTADHLTNQITVALVDGSQSRRRLRDPRILDKAVGDVAQLCVDTVVGQDPLKAAARAQRVRGQTDKVSNVAAGLAFRREGAARDLSCLAALLENDDESAAACQDLALAISPKDAVLCGWLANHLTRMVDAACVLRAAPADPVNVAAIPAVVDVADTTAAVAAPDTL